MSFDISLPRQFEAIRDKDERIFWVGKPAFIPFILTGVPFLIFGLLWGAFDYPIVVGIMKGGLDYPMMGFFALHLFPFWGSILNMARLFLVYGNTFYAYSNRRLMMRSGFWGTDFRAIDYDRIQDIEVNVNPVENLLGVGTINAFSGGFTSKGGRIYDKFIAISNPYDVFKRIKELTVDIKTDWNYPNALRPEKNPGYRTEYEPGR